MTSPQRPRVAATPTAPEGVTAERDDLKTLIAWLRKRSEPDSGIRYEAASVAFDGTGFRPARAELLGTDADFVAKHFHGRGAAELAAALAALAQRRDEVVEALREFYRLSLVVESAVRTCDGPNHPAVLAAIRAARATLITPEPK